LTSKPHNSKPPFKDCLRRHSICTEFSDVSGLQGFHGVDPLAFIKSKQETAFRTGLAMRLDRPTSGADYRTANAIRSARPSDSKDLTISAAVFPYVSMFVTDDGYLHNDLAYVKKMLPTLQTELRRPSRHESSVS
jgi:hypothetical protein